MLMLVSVIQQAELPDCQLLRSPEGPAGAASRARRSRTGGIYAWSLALHHLVRFRLELQTKAPHLDTQQLMLGRYPGMHSCIEVNKFVVQIAAP